MKGQIFILGALAITLAFFFAIPAFQQEIYLPDTDLSQLENIAYEYNKWIAYSSIDVYNPLDFGEFVNKTYSGLDFFYILAVNQSLHVANFFNDNLSMKINGENISVLKGSLEQISFQNEINFSSEFVNFTYIPNHSYSGVIFLRSDKGVSMLELLKIYG